MPYTFADLNLLDRPAFTAALAHLFEHSRWVAEETWPRRPFRDAAHLHAELCATMRAADSRHQLTLLRAHPDLGGRLAQQNQLTPESTREQSAAGLRQLTSDDLAALQNLNDAYRARFGFPFIICARLNARAAILTALNTRLVNTPAKEHSTALDEIEKIAWLRLRDTIAS